MSKTTRVEAAARAVIDALDGRRLDGPETVKALRAALALPEDAPSSPVPGAPEFAFTLVACRCGHPYVSHLGRQQSPPRECIAGGCVCVEYRPAPSSPASAPATCKTCGSVDPTNYGYVLLKPEQRNNGGQDDVYGDCPDPFHSPATAPAASEAVIRKGRTFRACRVACGTCKGTGEMTVLHHVEAPNETEVYGEETCAECDGAGTVAGRVLIDDTPATAASEAGPVAWESWRDDVLAATRDALKAEGIVFNETTVDGEMGGVLAAVHKALRIVIPHGTHPAPPALAEAERRFAEAAEDLGYISGHEHHGYSGLTVEVQFWPDKVKKFNETLGALLAARAKGAKS